MLGRFLSSNFSLGASRFSSTAAPCLTPEMATNSVSTLGTFWPMMTWSWLPANWQPRTPLTFLIFSTSALLLSFRRKRVMQLVATVTFSAPPTSSRTSVAICLLSTAMGPLPISSCAYPLGHRHAFGPATITPYGYRTLGYAVVNNVFTERLLALVYTECLICGNFAVWSPVNGRKSGVNVFEQQKSVYLVPYWYLANYAGFYFDEHLYSLLTH